MTRFEVTTWGARGTLPVTGEQARKYGGDTSCVEVRAGDRLLVFDAGSGLVPLGRRLLQGPERRLDLFISHAHLDHVLGLPYFAPFFRPDWQITLWFAGSDGAEDPEGLLAALIRKPLLPFSPGAFKCDLTLRSLPKRGVLEFGGDIRLTTAALHHPGGNTGLRIDHASRSFAYCCDYEPDGGSHDAEMVAFLGGADLAFLDCTYTAEEYERSRGFGHAHWRQSCDIARLAGVGTLGLFHHSPDRCDAALDGIEMAAGQITPSFAVRQGQTRNLIRGDLP